jgi:hypothetical protein
MPKKSGLAKASCVFSALFIIPFFSLIGLILGIIAMEKIKKDPDLEGEKLAITGIILGAIGLVIMPFFFPGIGLVITDIIRPVEPFDDFPFDETDFQELPTSSRQLTYTTPNLKLQLNKEFKFGIAYYHKSNPSTNTYPGFLECTSPNLTEEQVNGSGGFIDNIIFITKGEGLAPGEYAIYTLTLSVEEGIGLRPGDYICNLCIFEDTNNDGKIARNSDPEPELIYYCEQKVVKIVQ